MTAGPYTLKRHIGLISILLSAMLIIAGCKSLLTPAASLPELTDAFYVGTDSCIPCHDDIYVHYRRTVHYRLDASELNGMKKGCESCHGPGSIHVRDKGGVNNLYNFYQLTPFQSSEICLSCHQGEPVMNWQANSHLLNDVGCNECHKSHKTSGPKMVYLGDPEICFSCHQEKQAQHLLPSHHPVSEGKMKCGSCHENHGSENNNLREETLNDVCSACHAEYQGPFTFEHDPVVEDCSICHDPHGTITNNLLKQSQPFLCLRCHRGHRENREAGPHPTAAAFLTSCTQCHSRVHGSDLPSQLNRDGLTR